MNTINKAVIIALMLIGASFGQVVSVSSGPPPAVSQLGYSQTGVLGVTTYYYQVVTHYASGATFSPIIQVNNSNGTLNSSNYNTITWAAVANAVGYDLLRFTTSVGYAGTCTCSVTTLTTSTTVNDQSNTVSSYTAPAGAIGGTYQIYLNTRDHVGPELRFTNLNGTDQPLGNSLGGARSNNFVTNAAVTTHTLGIVTSGKITTALTSSTGLGAVVGIIKDTAASGATVDVATDGTAVCTFDSGGVTQGDLVITSTATAGDCEDSGQTVATAIAPTVQIIGLALTTATGGNTATVLLWAGNTGAGAGGGPGRVLTSYVTCGSTAACPSTSETPMHVVFGTGTLASGSPSTYAVTTISPAFTSASTYACWAQDTTTIANNIGVLAAGYVSGTAVTFTGPNTNTDGFRFTCIGY